ncbi:MAG: 4-hydroxy-tetrahydrodipicolinate synthase [Armatimonadota bacterium]|nr:4-hydroxy-tetrahydrodipicolinate synthase [Armatimonadota bacterium]
MRFEGAWTALVTPMTTSGDVDWDGYRKNIDFQLSQGISGIVPVGTTGESPTLDWDEHNHAVEVALDEADGHCEVLAGTGSNSTSEAIASTRYAVGHGAKGALLVDCYYNGPSSLELRKEYYDAVAEKFPDVSIVPYIIPGRTGTAMSAEDLAILASERSNVHAVKEATGDLKRMALTRDLCGPDFAIMSGDDDLTFQMMTDPRIKANGVISVMSNIAPAAIQAMTHEAAEGNVQEAEEIRRALDPIFGVVVVKVNSQREIPGRGMAEVSDKFRNPLPVKTMMRVMGMPSGPCRQPLGKMSKDGLSVLRSALTALWERNPEVLAPIQEFYGVDIASRLADDRIWNKLAY